MSPPVLVEVLLGLHDEGDLCRCDEGILAGLRQGRSRGRSPHRVPVEDVDGTGGAAPAMARGRVLLLVRRRMAAVPSSHALLVLLAAEDGRDGPNEQAAQPVLPPEQRVGVAFLLQVPPLPPGGRLGGGMEGPGRGGGGRLLPPAAAPLPLGHPVLDLVLHQPGAEGPPVPPHAVLELPLQPGPVGVLGMEGGRGRRRGGGGGGGQGGGGKVRVEGGGGGLGPPLHQRHHGGEVAYRSRHLADIRGGVGVGVGVNVGVGGSCCLLLCGQCRRVGLWAGTRQGGLGDGGLRDRAERTGLAELFFLISCAVCP